MTKALRLPVLLLICLILPFAANAQSTYSGRITNSIIVDTYPIDAKQYLVIDITMERVSGDLTPFLALRDSQKRIVARSSTRAGDRAATLHYQFAASGRYEVVASRLDAEDGTTSGDYILSMNGSAIEQDSQLPPSFQSPAIVIPSADSTVEFTGRANDSNPVNYYLVHLNSGQTLHGTMTQSTGDLYPTLALTDLNLTLVGQRGKSEDKKISTLDTQVNESGWYVLIAARFDNEQGLTSGTYRLTVNIQ